MSKANPEEIDYNKDKVVDSYDDLLAVQDKNKDGKVSDKEKANYKRKQGQTKTIVETAADGTQTIREVPLGEAPPEPTLSAGELGYSDSFLTENEDVRVALDLAIEYGWTEEQFTRYVEANTAFGQNTTDTQALFDIEIAGEKSEEWQTKIDNKFAELKQAAGRLGLTGISDETLKTQAREIVRSGLSQTAVDAFWQTSYLEGVSPENAALMGEQAVMGTASEIQDQLASMARNYGIRITEEMLAQKTGDALGQGERWREWVNGQADFFREQAKILYPNAAGMLDNMTLQQITEPYFADAANTLGLSGAQIDIMDPKWTAFLGGGSNGGVMSRDEWERLIKTDQRYGYDQSTNARQEAANLGDALLSAFGMA